MIRHFAAATTIALSIGLLSSCNEAAITAPEAAPAVEQGSHVEKATALVDQLMAGNYGTVVAEFNPTMAAAMPESLLSTTLAQIQQQTGAYKERTGTREAEEAGFQVVYVTTVFEKATLQTKVVYDANGQVAGLFIQP